MTQYIIKRTIFLTPKGKNAGNKSLVPTPNRVVLKKGDTFEGTIKPSTIPNVDSILTFVYNGYDFEKPYGGTDPYAKMNQRDIALVGTPEAELVIYKPKPPKTETTTTTTPSSMEESKSTSETNILQFKDKLHAGVTLIGVALGVYYAYKTKSSVTKYIGYALGAGAVGFILGGVASSFAMQTPIKEKKANAEQLPEGVKPLNLPSFDGVYGNGMSVEENVMDSPMKSIL
jgi:hypothetical protein